jgi:hypothetical protein
MTIKSSKNFIKNDIIFSDTKVMTIKGYTIKEMADEIGISYEAAQKRIERARIKPILKEDLYPESTLDAIRNTPGPGRPPKTKPEEPDKA